MNALNEIEYVQLQNAKLSTELVTKDVLTSYIDPDAYVHLTGDQNIGALHVSADLSAANLNCDNNLAVGKRHYIQSDNVVVEGLANKVGAKGYNMTSGNFYTKKIVIDNNQSLGFKVGDVLSFKFGKNSNTSFMNSSTIVNIDQNTIEVDIMPGASDNINLYDSDGNMQFDLGTRLVFSYNNPVGDVVMGSTNHVEGAFNKTEGNTSWAHIEGFKNNALDNYAHVEGMSNIASHSAHAEGRFAEAIGVTSHAEGQNVVASGTCSHVGGIYAADSTLSNSIEDVSIELNEGDYIAFKDVGKYNKVIIKIDPSLVYDPTISGEVAPFDLDTLPSGYEYAYKGVGVTLKSLRSALMADPRSRDGSVHHSYFVAKTKQCNNNYDYDIDWVSKVIDQGGVLEYRVLSSNSIPSYAHSYVWNGNKNAHKTNFYESHGDGTFNVNPLLGANGFYVGNDTLPKIIDDHVNDFGKIVVKLSSNTPQLINSDVSLSNNLSISQNLLIGDDNISYSNYSQLIGHGCIAFTNDAFANGTSCIAGTHSFRVISGDISACTWHLHSVDGIEPGMWYTVRLFANYDMVGKVVKVLSDEMKISVDAMPNVLSTYQAVIRTTENLSDEYLSAEPFYDPTGNGLRAHPSNVDTEAGVANEYPASACFDDFDTDCNTLWIYRHPELGDLSSYATGSHTEGYMSQASRQFSHAEGLCCVAIGKYAHAEGWQTDAVWAAHSEGRQTKAYGQSSHTEGIYTQTRGSGAHAEGHSTIANGVYSHTEGERAIANFAGSFVWNGDANKNYSDKEDHTFNINPKNGLGGFYIGDRSLAELGESGVITPSIYRNLNNALDDIDDIRKAFITKDMPVDVRVQISGDRGSYVQYRTGKMTIPSQGADLSSPYGNFTLIVEPGDELSIQTNMDFQAGIAAYDLNQNMISTWNADDNYIDIISTDNKCSQTNWDNFKKLSAETGISAKAQLDGYTIDDKYHWSRLHYQNFSTYIKPSHDALSFNTYVLTVPENCYLLKVSNLSQFKTVYPPQPNMPMTAKHMRNVIDRDNPQLNVLSGETWTLSAKSTTDIVIKIASKLGMTIDKSGWDDNN